MKQITIGRFPFWVPDNDAAASDCCRVATPVLIGDEYRLAPIRRAGHWPQYFVDVGGNAGSFGVKVADIFPGAKLLACEPFDELTECYGANAAELPVTLHLHQLAAVDQDVSAVPFSVVENEASGWAGNFVTDSWQPPYPASRQVMVPAARLSQLLRLHGFPRIDVLKLDCEGSEASVLADLQQAGWLHRTRWLRFEWHGPENLTRCLALLAETHVASARRREGQINGFGLAHSRKDGD
jgi:FkbM family methyltransferase